MTNDNIKSTIINNIIRIHLRFQLQIPNILYEFIFLTHLRSWIAIIMVYCITRDETQWLQRVWSLLPERSVSCIHTRWIRCVLFRVMHMGHNFSSDTTPKNEVVGSGLKFGWLESYLMILPTKCIFLDLLAESTILPAAFHSRKNDFCAPFFWLNSVAKFIV